MGKGYNLTAQEMKKTAERSIPAELAAAIAAAAMTWMQAQGTHHLESLTLLLDRRLASPIIKISTSQNKIHRRETVPRSPRRVRVFSAPPAPVTPGAGHSRSWAVGQKKKDRTKSADVDDGDVDEPWEDDFNFDELAVHPTPHVPHHHAHHHAAAPTATARPKAERFALNYRLVDIVGRAYGAINELADEEVKVQQVCNPFKHQTSGTLDVDAQHSNPPDPPSPPLWMDRVVHLLATSCLSTLRDHTKPNTSSLDQVADLLSPASTTAAASSLQLVAILHIWLKVERHALQWPHHTDVGFQSITSAIAAARLQFKLTAATDETTDPLVVLTGVVLSEMHDSVVTYNHHASAMSSSSTSPSISPAKPYQQLAMVSLLRLAILSVVFLGYKHHVRHTPWPVVATVAHVMAQLLLSSFELSLAMDFACLTTKIAAYVTHDDALVAESKAAQCQAQTELATIQGDGEHEQSMALLVNLPWASSNNGRGGSSPPPPPPSIQPHLVDKTDNGADDDAADSDSSDWDLELQNQSVSLDDQPSGSVLLQHPSSSTSSLSTILNMRELFVPAKEQKTTSWHLLMTQVMEHPPSDHAPLLPPPSSPYSRSFAAFENGHVLTNALRSTRSMDQWLLDLACAAASPSRRAFQLGEAMHEIANMPKFTRAWLQRYEACCSSVRWSAPDLCFNLVHTFFNHVHQHDFDAVVDDADDVVLEVIDVGLRLCSFVAADSHTPVYPYPTLLRPLVDLVLPPDSRPRLRLRCDLIVLECRIQHALTANTDDFFDSPLQLELWQALHALSVDLVGLDHREKTQELELSMILHINAHALHVGVTPLTIKPLQSRPWSMTCLNECTMLDAAPTGHRAPPPPSSSMESPDYVLHHPLAPTPCGTWRRLVHLYPLLPLTSHVRIRAGILMGVSLYHDDVQVQDAENILYESIYVLHTHFSLHSMLGCTTLHHFGDTLVATQKFDFAVAAFDSAYRIATRIDATSFLVDLERKLALLFSERGDVARSTRFYQKIRARSLAQGLWFEYVYITVTVATLLMDNGEYGAAAADIQPVLQHMQLVEACAPDVLAEVQVLFIRLSLCHLKLHCPQRAVSTLELCLQRYKPRFAKHVVVLMWMAKAYFKAGQVHLCERTLDTIATLRKENDPRHHALPHGGSFAKLPPPFPYSIPSHHLDDLYPLHAQAALHAEDYERAAHYSALSIVSMEFHGGAHLAALYYLRGKVWLAATHAPWLFPMQLHCLESEQLLLTRKGRVPLRRKSLALTRDQRVVVTLDECTAPLRAFHHSYELFKAQDDKLGMTKAASRLAGVYLRKVFLARMVLRRPLDSLLMFSLKRRQASTTSAQDVKGDATSSSVEFEFTLDDIEQPARLAWEMSSSSMAPLLYIDACLNLAQVSSLRDKGADALGHWYEARDVFLNCILCPSTRSMTRYLGRLVETLLTFDATIVNDNLVLLELFVMPASAWPDAPFLKKTHPTRWKRTHVAAETSLTYQAKLREKPAKGGHQRHKSDTLELLATKQHSSALLSGTSTRLTVQKQSSRIMPSTDKERPTKAATESVEARLRHSFAMLKHNRDHGIDATTQKNCKGLREIWHQMDAFRGASLASWLAIMAFDKESPMQASIVYALDLAQGALLATYVPATGACEWTWFEHPQVTRLSAHPSTTTPHPFRRFQVDQTKVLPPPPATVRPEFYTASTTTIRQLHLAAFEFAQRLPLVLHVCKATTTTTGSAPETTTSKENDVRTATATSLTMPSPDTKPKWSLVTSPSLVSLPWEWTSGNGKVVLVRRVSAFVDSRPSSASPLPLDFQLYRIKTPMSQQIPSTIVSPWWRLLGSTVPKRGGLPKKGTFPKRVIAVHKIAVSSLVKMDDQDRIVRLVLVSYTELYAPLQWMQHASNFIWVFAPPAYLPLLAAVMLRCLPHSPNDHHPTPLFGKRRPPLPPHVTTALGCVRHAISVFQVQHSVPVVVFSLEES
ncbi:Aste57867_16472 [Aphanomyces stellatus]|uniref:Aste57867_16472 protein n=1 Tax=Aphanomyces stellatus TaxID=120398 RepID=A0A485L733_9STRA|nr:hypothetical protein As57867_016415 [Aphanomyces stellatus]VFT93246.1 Aste57867_16472 [Aphanomyces stellatus]